MLRSDMANWIILITISICFVNLIFEKYGLFMEYIWLTHLCWVNRLRQSRYIFQPDWHAVRTFRLHLKQIYVAIKAGLFLVRRLQFWLYFPKNVEMSSISIMKFSVNSKFIALISFQTHQAKLTGSPLSRTCCIT